ncbi:MAG: AmmeMemoRadiSam system protein B, partial [bacterium]|nr:AmmeMemoRadiSam system protein B [bacterium]
MTYPPLRYVEAFRFEHQGRPMVLVRDPEGICSEALAVPIPLFLIMSLLDGHRDAPAVQEAVRRLTGGHIIPLEEIDRIVADIDAHCLLTNERSTARRLELEAEFARLPNRPASHAGGAYPATPAECARHFDELFDGLTAVRPVARPRGLVVPHIDFRVGGRTIARALATLDPSAPPRLYIILGVAHQPARNLFTLTDKSFETPLGLVETDREAAASLRAAYGAGRLDGEYAHRLEHSIEFQAVALKHLHRRASGLRILPILCGPLVEEMLPGDGAPSARSEVGDFIAALKEIIARHDGDVCLIASVDLSHVGRKFGDERGIDDLRKQSVGLADERMLAHVEAMDAEMFFNHFREDGNARHVDAVTAVYVLLHALAPARVQRLDYEQWHETETDSMVTFAGARPAAPPSGRRTIRQSGGRTRPAWRDK